MVSTTMKQTQFTWPGAGWFCLVLALLMASPDSDASLPSPSFKSGAVYARDIVRDADGNPVYIYVEYNSEGEETGWQHPQSTDTPLDLDLYRVMSATQYRALVKQYKALFDSLGDVQVDDVLKTRSEFTSGSYTSADGSAITPPEVAGAGSPAERWETLLREDTATVVIAPQESRYSTDPTELVLLQLPIDPRLTIPPEDPENPDENLRSLLLKTDEATGNVRIERRSLHNIGFRVGFYGTGTDVSTSTTRSADEQIYGPLTGVPVSVVSFSDNDKDWTDSEGKYKIQYYLPSCPGFIAEFNSVTLAELHFKRFDPQGGPTRPYSIYRWDKEYCYSYLEPSYDGLFVNFEPVSDSMFSYTRRFDFPIDLMVLNGRAQLTTNQNGAIPLGETRYDSSRSSLERVAQASYDLDGDGTGDTAVLGKITTDADGNKSFIRTGEGETPEAQGVWLSSKNIEPTFDATGLADPFPDLTRLPDWSADFEDRALLSSISEEDLADTDLYVFRESDGTLLMERKGLPEDDSDEDKRYIGVDSEQGKFAYTLRLVGSRGRLYGGDIGSDQTDDEFSQWQQTEGVNDEALQKHEADHLRPGERVRIIAINRVSGYLGSKSVELQAAGNSEGDSVEISFNVEDIQLVPPNLKVWAKRRNRIQLGLTEGEVKEHLIGNEGAGLNDDEFITVYTSWFGPDGELLPEELGDYGYTARLAKVDLSGSLVDSSFTEHFSVKPGIKMQLLRLPEEVSLQHYYVQINGKQRNASFENVGVNGGVLSDRPNTFVPFKTPHYDEALSNDVRRTLLAAGTDTSQIKPVYQWLYRPEFQFSVYELANLGVTRTDSNDEKADLLNLSEPEVYSGDTLLSVYYDLSTSENPTPDAYSFDGERELVFSLGGQEVSATLGEDNTVNFEDPAVLASMNPEDYVTLQLYANNDSANVLWEYSFGLGLLVSWKLPHEEQFISPEEEENEGKLYRLLGGLRLRYAYILPPQAEPIAYVWTFAPNDQDAPVGRFCEDYGVATVDCENSDTKAGVDIDTVYWEPPEWTTDVDYNGSLVVEYKLNGEVETVIEQFRVASRELRPVDENRPYEGSTEPMEGTDVAMLEQVLWQLGISPQKSGAAINSNGQAYTAYKAGSEGARINSDRGGNSGWTLSCSGEPADDRSVFYLDQPNCPTSRVSTELMVKRFNARNLDDGTVVTLQEVNSTRGDVDHHTLSWLKRDWGLYTAAFRELQEHTVFERSTGDMTRWIEEAVEIWESGLGETVPATLTEANYNTVLRSAGLTDNARSRSDLLIGWLEEETRYHWGDNLKHYQTTDFRMVEGGADENGSLSFSQLLYHYRFGPNPCAAHGEAQLNLYHPAGNMRTMVIHTASDATDGANTQNCQGGLHKAFVTNTLRNRYDQGGNMADLRGYINNASGAVVALNVANREGDYEALAKGIGIYNGNGTAGSPIFTANSWPKLLKTMEYRENSTRNSATVCHSCKYSILVRNKAGVLAGNLRRYVWHGGNTASGQPWCFAYGESEWVSNAQIRNDDGSTRRKVFSDYQREALLDTDLRVACH